jgi:secreted PhoX family phosphatase
MVRGALTRSLGLSHACCTRRRMRRREFADSPRLRKVVQTTLARMNHFTRRSFLHRSGMLVGAGVLAPAVCSRALARATSGARISAGYGALIADPAGVLDLPRGFRYRVFSRAGEQLSDGHRVPAAHDGMSAFGCDADSSWLIRNHELSLEDVTEGATAVAHVRGKTYDPAAVGGTTTLRVSHDRKLLSHRVSLAGTIDNCGGGPTPWHTWLTCEETLDILEKPHGYVFEVDPARGGNPEPIRAMGRFEHEAVSFATDGTAYLTEDASGPFGCVYRFRPQRPHGGLGSLHAGGTLQAMAIEGVDVDLSSVCEPGSVHRVRWVDIRNVDPGAHDASVREQAIGRGATPIQKAEGTWRGLDGCIWLVSSYGAGPDAEDDDALSVRAHGGQIWRYDPRRESIELVVIQAPDSPYDGPDNITAGPHGFAVACTDGERDQWLLGVTSDGATFPFARNALSDAELAGATFSPDGQTLFANMQGDPALTFAIWGPWTG